ncbi:radical SAM protein [Allofournierella sp.]|uniref:radical SAM protein n=1 Tax=Allofournierella sp. TaxID=1940256 RepID=UPI003AB2EFB3
MAEPFIHLLRTPQNYYFYDVQKNAVVRISESLYHCLLSGISDNSTETQELKKYGFLSSKHPSCIEHSCTSHIQDYLDRSLIMMTLQVTQQCNLRCDYCLYSENSNELQRHHENKHMSFETAKRAIDFLLTHSVDSSTVSIGFYGGEPLLQFPLIKKVVEYAESLFTGKIVQFNITTNATLITDEIADYLVKKRFATTISMDGPKSIQDSHRKFPDGSGTFDIVYDRIHRLIERYPNFTPFLSVNMVIDPRRPLDEPMELIKLLPDVHIMTSEIDDFYMDEKIIPCKRYREEYEYQIFLAALYALGLLEKSCVSPVVHPIISSIQNTLIRWKHYNTFPTPSAPSGPCIPGAQRLFVSVDGTMYPCERVSEVSSILSIGNIYNGFNYSASQKMLNIAKITESHCSKCWAFHFCGGCIRDTFDGSGIPSAQKRLSKCYSYRAMGDVILYGAVMLREIPLYYREQLQEATK